MNPKKLVKDRDSCITRCLLVHKAAPEALAKIQRALIYFPVNKKGGNDNAAYDDFLTIMDSTIGVYVRTLEAEIEKARQLNIQIQEFLKSAYQGG